jgi:heterodisulfide reductase subunit B
MKKSNNFLKSGEEKAKKILDSLKKVGCEYKGTIDVKHPMEFLTNEYGLEQVKEKVRRPLTNLKVACYYGCQLVRPYTDFDDPDNPVSLDNLMEAIGAEPVPYSVKTRCCGGSLAGTLDEVGIGLNYVLIKEAERRGADVIATICPLCQLNVEMMQDKIIKKHKDANKIPVLYFSQLMGLALGISKDDLGFSRSFHSLDKMWEKLGMGGKK